MVSTYRFVDDLSFKNMLVAATVRSRVPHGRIISLDGSAAEQHGVCITRSDIPGRDTIGTAGAEIPVLAGTTVCYVGEPVALVAAPASLVREAAEAVAVVYEDLPACADPDDAQDDLVAHQRRGEPEAAFHDAGGVVEAEYQVAACDLSGATPTAALARWDGKTLTLNVATSHPFRVRDLVASVLAVAPPRVRVIAARSSGSCAGGTATTLAAIHVALLAWRTGKPVKLRYEPTEQAESRPVSHPCRIACATALGNAGVVLAQKVEVVTDGGARRGGSGGFLERIVAAGMRGRQCVDITARLRLTNRIPSGESEAWKDVEIAFATEVHATELARSAGVDPYTWRRGTLAAPTDTRGRAVLDRVVEISDFSRRFAAYEATRRRRGGSAGAGLPVQGIGISLWSVGHDSAAGPAAVKITMSRERRATVYSSVVQTGRGGQEMIRRTVAEVLGISLEQVKLAGADTAAVPDSGPTTEARTAAIIVPLISRCCRNLKRRLATASLPLSAQARKKAEPDTAGTATVAATVVRVRQDSVTGAVRCTGWWSVVDAGHVVDPEGARRLVVSAGHRAMERVLGEGMSFRDGRVIPHDRGANPCFAMADVCEAAVELVDGRNVGGAAPAGGVIAAVAAGLPPALASAAEQASMTFVRSMPIAHLPPGGREDRA